MRVLLALLIPVFLFGSISGYLSFTESIRPRPAAAPSDRDTAAWTVRMTPAARLVPDAEYDIPALRVLYRGSAILEKADSVEGGESIQVDLDEVSVGENSLLVEAHFEAPVKMDFENPSSGESGRFSTSAQASPVVQALRILVLRNGETVIDQTLWAETPDLLATGEVRFDGWLIPVTEASGHE